jgi:DNA-binding transcriptional MerR regulator
LAEGKTEGAFRTIGELSAELGVPQHILRYWETRFPQLRPLTRAGNRRYYRPEDVALVRRIHGALSHDGFTIKGVQRLLSGKSDAPDALPSPGPDGLMAELMRVRDQLKAALEG